MRSSLLSLLFTSVVSVACSSSSTPTSDRADASDAGDAAADVVPLAPCVEDTKRVPKAETGLCCDGLYKVCSTISVGDQSPCICSTVLCGTPDKQLPPNVPCCGGASSCQGTPDGNTQCTCK